MKNIIINNVEYKQCEQAPRIWIAKDGTYVIPNSDEPEKVREGSKNYNKDGYPLQMQICTTVKITLDDGTVRSKAKVFNVGRLVLDAWLNQIDKNLEVDHIDRDPFNNNIDNLRLVTRSGNVHKKKKVNPTWCHTKEVAIKREATKKAIREGLIIREVKEPKEKRDQDKTIINSLNTQHDKVINNKESRRVNSIEQKITVLTLKRERWEEGSKNYINYTNQINELMESK